MARMRSMDALERKIERAQEQVSRTKKQYDAAIASLSELLDKRDALRKDELMKVFTNSDKTYEEAMAFLDSGEEKKDCQENGGNQKTQF